MPLLLGLSVWLATAALLLLVYWAIDRAWRAVQVWCAKRYLNRCIGIELAEVCAAREREHAQAVAEFAAWQRARQLKAVVRAGTTVH